MSSALSVTCGEFAARVHPTNLYGAYGCHPHKMAPWVSPGAVLGAALLSPTWFYHITGQDVSIGDSSYYRDQEPGKKQLKRGRVCCGSTRRGAQSIMTGKVWLKDVWGPLFMSGWIREQGPGNAGLQFTFSFFLVSFCPEGSWFWLCAVETSSANKKTWTPVQGLRKKWDQNEPRPCK